MNEIRILWLIVHLRKKKPDYTVRHQEKCKLNKYSVVDRTSVETTISNRKQDNAVTKVICIKVLNSFSKWKYEENCTFIAWI